MLHNVQASLTVMTSFCRRGLTPTLIRSAIAWVSSAICAAYALDITILVCVLLFMIIHCLTLDAVRCSYEQLPINMPKCPFHLNAEVCANTQSVFTLDTNSCSHFLYSHECMQHAGWINAVWSR